MFILSFIILKFLILFILYSNEGAGSSWQINHFYKAKAAPRAPRAIVKAKVDLKAKVELKKALKEINKVHQPPATVKAIVEARPRPKPSTSSSSSSPTSRTHPSKGAPVKHHKVVIKLSKSEETMRQIQRVLLDNGQILSVTCVPNKVHY